MYVKIQRVSLYLSMCANLDVNHAVVKNLENKSERHYLSYPANDTVIYAVQSYYFQFLKTEMPRS